MIIGITGSLATGKSTTARYLTSCLRGHLIDADRIAHLALSKRSPVYKNIVSAFGKDILSKKKTVDRKKLAKKAFSKDENLKRLCRIVHPFVISRIKKAVGEIYKKNNSAFILIDAPVLIEAGLYKECDQLIVVVSSLVAQVERAQHNKGLGPKDSLARIRSQMPLYKKANYADYIIDNDGSLKELKGNVRRLAEKLQNFKGRKRKW